jgi:hypothetical protein
MIYTNRNCTVRSNLNEQHESNYHRGHECIFGNELPPYCSELILWNLEGERLADSPSRDAVKCEAQNPAYHDANPTQRTAADAEFRLYCVILRRQEVCWKSGPSNSEEEIYGQQLRMAWSTTVQSR